MQYDGELIFPLSTFIASSNISVFISRCHVISNDILWFFKNFGVEVKMII